jgi:hypothetical protein
LDTRNQKSNEKMPAEFFLNVPPAYRDRALQNAVSARVFEQSVQRERILRDRVRPWLDAGYNLRELEIVELNRRHLDPPRFDCVIRNSHQVHPRRLRIRRLLAALGFRASPDLIFRRLDRGVPKKKVEALMWHN